MFQRLFVIALATVLTRSIPFIFLKNKEIPEKFMKIIDALPYATISLLVVYCFKDRKRQITTVFKNHHTKVILP